MMDDEEAKRKANNQDQKVGETPKQVPDNAEMEYMSQNDSNREKV